VPERLDGEVALVTGSGRGIGRGVAEALAQAGARVTLMSRSQDQLEETARAIDGAGGQALVVVGDVTSAADVQRAVAETAARFGPISLLVSNAGITGPYAPVWDADPEEWWRTQEVHVRGAMLCTRGVWDGMVARGGGRLIFVSSRAAERGGANLSAYQIAKASQLRLTEALAAEGAGVGIRAFVLHPGTVDTNFADQAMTRSDSQKYLPDFVARLQAIRRDPSLGTPMSLVTELCVFLASGAADALSGRYFRVEDDWAEMVRGADRIQRDDLYTLRLRTLAEPGGPQPPSSPPDH
jgi:NAD(P)-dependent dehydrogenase (short-subunit alcohol dehydrogenase family)